MISSAEPFVALRTSDDPADQARAATETASAGVWHEVIAEYPEMRFWVAQNKTVPLEVLAELAGDEDPRVRSMVARKRKIGEDILEGLANDDDESVRVAVARHPRTSAALLMHLSDDSWDEVRRVANERLSGMGPMARIRELGS